METPRVNGRKPEESMFWGKANGWDFAIVTVIFLFNPFSLVLILGTIHDIYVKK